jgi:hypothetical protein
MTIKNRLQRRVSRNYQIHTQKIGSQSIFLILITVEIWPEKQHQNLCYWLLGDVVMQQLVLEVIMDHRKSKFGLRHAIKVKAQSESRIAWWSPNFDFRFFLWSMCYSQCPQFHNTQLDSTCRNSRCDERRKANAKFSKKVTLFHVYPDTTY